MKDPYKVLGISPNATNEEVKAAYKALVKKYHPDNYADSPISDIAEEKMQEINEAYDEILRQRAEGASGGGSQSYQGSTSYANIRSLINNGRIDEADAELNKIAQSERNAEWSFLKACILTQRGYYFDAMKFADAACNMDPMNDEYRQLRDNLQRRAGGYQQNTYNGNAGGCNMCDVCSALICLDCLCR